MDPVENNEDIVYDENELVLSAEHAFATMSFNILDENALFTILAELDPLSIISLCQSNVKFARLCSKKSTFINLMALHYPQYPLDVEDPKKQYVDITGGIGVIYSVDITGYRKIINDSLGNDIFVGYQFADKAYVNPDGKVYDMGVDRIIFDDRKTLSFRIRGTKIRRGEKLWLAIEHNGNQLEGKVYSTKEEAVRDMDIFSDNSSMSLYDQTLQNLKVDYNYVERYNRKSWEQDAPLSVSDPKFIEFTRRRNFPAPFTLDNIYDYIMANGVFNVTAYRLRQFPEVYRSLMNPNYKGHEGDEMLQDMQDELNELHRFHVIPITIL